MRSTRHPVYVSFFASRFFSSSSSRRSAFCRGTPFCVEGVVFGLNLFKKFRRPIFRRTFYRRFFHPSLQPRTREFNNIELAGRKSYDRGVYRSRFINILDERRAICSSFINISTHYALSFHYTVLFSCDSLKFSFHGKIALTKLHLIRLKRLKNAPETFPN